MNRYVFIAISTVQNVVDKIKNGTFSDGVAAFTFILTETLLKDWSNPSWNDVKANIKLQPQERVV